MSDLLVETNCACTSLRKTTRSITQFYDRMLRPAGLRCTQLSLLSQISGRGTITFGELGERLLMDQTTVTRNVDNLKKLGYVSITNCENDARKKYITISAAGAQKLAEAAPLWREAHARITQGLGGERYDELMALLSDVERLVE
jgi:DNA-binding MarR family transcriptional regulator